MMTKLLIAAIVLNVLGSGLGIAVIVAGAATWATGLCLGINLGMLFHLWLQREYGKIIDSYREMLSWR